LEAPGVLNVIGNDLGSGAHVDVSSFTLECREVNQNYRVVSSESGGRTIRGDICLVFRAKYAGGDPLSPHYSAPGDPADSDSGLDAGAAAAIALGVILLVVVVVVVLLIVLGKLVFSRGTDVSA
jgi:hypothetical protein